MKKLLFSILCMASTYTVHAQTEISTTDLTTLSKVTDGSVVSIHDPSVVFHNGTYTVWGSHLGCATSTDLVHWTPRWADGNTFRRLASHGSTSSSPCGFADAFNIQRATKVRNLNGVEVDFPNFDAEAYCARYAEDRNTWINGDLWAPDIIYNPTMQKWCMYLSLNGDHWSSIIILLTSNSSTGPFTYEGPIVMGGFTGQSYGGVAAPTINETDYTIATGETSIAARYIRPDNGSYWPNCIDPCVFYDEQGELWMSYGSWSGGIFMLKLDKQTGLRDYTYTYTSDYASAGVNGLSDPYFGKKIAGGGYASGEGSYIQHIGDYYYLFMSYGGFAPDGGYEMRIFRSQNPDGPYVDGSDTKATNGGYIMNYGPNARTNMGMKLMGSYNNWGNQNVGECAQGHNSACTDDKGRSFVVYHTKFNDGTAGHQVRVHQLFVNEKGWLVAAPFSFAGETTTDQTIASGCPWTKEQIAGTYHLLFHPYKMDHLNFQESTPTDITLTTDGKITGSRTGSWKMNEGTSQITLIIGGSNYYGVLCEQQVNGATRNNFKRTGYKAIAVTAQNNSGTSIWAYKLDEASSIALNYSNQKDIFTTVIKNGNSINSNKSIMFDAEENTVLTWTSSDTEHFSNTGKYNPEGLTEDKPLTLTARMQCGQTYWQQTYEMTLRKASTPSGDWMSNLLAYYDFNSKPTYNLYKQEGAEDYDKVTYGRSNTTTGKIPAMESDYEREGMYVHQFFGAQNNCSYCRIPNPLYGATDLHDITVSMWVKRNDLNNYDALWSFFNSTSSSASGPRLFLTGNSFLSYNDNAGTWFDLNHPEDVADNTNIPVGKWALVTLTISETNGIKLYVDGANKTFSKLNASTPLTGSNVLLQTRSLPLDQVMQMIAAQKYFYLGMGSFWGTADACFDELMIYDRELSLSDIKGLYTMSNRVHNFGPADETAIETVSSESETLRRINGTFDLTGRRLQGQPTGHGLYIIDGKKVVK